MIVRARAEIVSAIAIACASAGPVASQTVVGTWDATWAQAVRTNGGELVEVQRWGHARLVLTQDGDSLIGTWWTEFGDVTWTVHGRFQAGRLKLESSANDSSDPELAIVTAMHWRATLAGDRIEGEMWLDLSGVTRRPARRPWHAGRAPPF